MEGNEGREAGNLWVEEISGESDDTLLLIHGRGANGAVWDKLVPFIRKEWRGRCLIPDLRGHGRSSEAANYSFGTFAADLAGIIPSSGRIGVIGHSLGGALGAFLASGWFGVEISCVLAASVKTVWSEEELVKFAAIAKQPVRWMAAETEAKDRFLRASGVKGHFEPADRFVDRGLRYVEGKGYRFSDDPGTIGSTGRQLSVLLKAALCPVRFVTGAQDVMAPAADMLAYDPGAVVIDPAGHNVHVERPDEIWRQFQLMWKGVEALQAGEGRVG
jgi:pimeloyl-ACP methyl ester carboxylesterase